MFSCCWFGVFCWFCWFFLVCKLGISVFVFKVIFVAFSRELGRGRFFWGDWMVVYIGIGLCGLGSIIL